jgi:K+-sensing histidine kinase KdpD
MEADLKLKVEFLEQRAQHLDDLNQRFRFSLRILGDFGKLQRRIGTERDLRVIQKEAAKVILNLHPFQSVGFVFIEDALNFNFDFMEPETNSELLNDELEKQIEAGNFALAMKQSKALVTHLLTNKLEGSATVLLHPLAAEGSDIGLFFGIIQEEKQKVNQEVLTLLSIVINTTALAMENAILYSDVQKHNETLNGLVEERTSQIRRFLSIASHDMRNPISCIRGMADLFKEIYTEETTEDGMEMIQTISSTSALLLDLLNDILDMTAIDSGELQLRKSNVNLIEIIQSVSSINKLTAERKDIKLEFTHEDVEETVYLDPLKIRQVVENLTTNAIKFSPRETNLKLNARMDGNRFFFQVKDEGPGIPEKERHLLFTEFGKTSVLPTGGESSTGLGLAISERIVKAHHGNIWVDCPEEGGSEFNFSLDFDVLNAEAEVADTVSEMV